MTLGIPIPRKDFLYDFKMFKELGYNKKKLENLIYFSCLTMITRNSIYVEVRNINYDVLLFMNIIFCSAPIQVEDLP